MPIKQKKEIKPLHLNYVKEELQSLNNYHFFLSKGLVQKIK